MPAALFFIFWELWVLYVRINFVRNIKWILLEIKIPKGVEKSPKAMEQVFAALHGTYSFGKRFMQKYWKGEVEDWMTLELVGRAGGVYFYIRCPEIYRNLVESAIYSQYSDAEIYPTEDYIDLWPSVLPNKDWDIWGTDFVLSRPSAYPIRTYTYFEEPAKEKRLDPIAAITEVMSKLKENEAILFQLLIRPTSDEWRKEALKIRDELIRRKKPVSRTLLGEIGAFIRNLFVALAEYPVWPGAPEEKPGTSMLLLSPGEKDIVEGIENKISKVAFEAMLRFIYIDSRKSFTRANISAVIGALRQFSAANLNSLRPNPKTMTLVRGLFKSRRLYARKRVLWDSYRLKRLPPRLSQPPEKQVPILNVEELATLYHFPSIIVEAPMLRPVIAKKGEPPIGLPVE